MAASLQSGGTFTCGNRKIHSPGAHGMKGTPTYGSWASMWTRCTNRKSASWKNYGRLGIRVCERWKSFLNFLEDMGVRPPGKTLERKDGSKDYSPDNCIWATYGEQQRNTSRTILVTLNGKTQCLKDWSDELGLDYGAVRARVNRLGWSPEDALQTPVRPKQKAAC